MTAEVSTILVILTLFTVVKGTSVQHVISGTFEWKSACSTEYVFKTVKLVTPTQCRWKCRIRANCVSVQYNKYFNSCELNGLVKNPNYDPSVAVTRPCLFISVAANTGDVNVCALRPCPDGQVCAANGNSGTDYTCNVEECVFPEIIPFAKLLSFVYDVGKVTRYICDEGYHGDGTDSITCLETGVWTNTDFVCSMLCGPPSSVDHADPTPPLSSGDTYTYGSTVTYACATGYTLLADDSVVCNASGNWEGVIQCQEDCPAPPVVANAVIDQALSNSTSVTYTCITGYSASDPLVSSCTIGVWSSTGVNCSENCGPPPTVTNAFISQPILTAVVGAVVQYSCEANFVWDGGITTTCLSNSTTYVAEWSPPTLGQHGCHKRCPRPSITDGTVHLLDSISDITFPPVYTFQYTCNNGFLPEGERTLTCGDDGVWTGAVTCTDDCSGVMYSYNETYGICYVAWDSILTVAADVCDIFDGGIVMDVQTTAKQEFAQAHIIASSLSGLFIGSKPDVLAWPSDNWADGEPNGTGDCVEISVEHGYQWNDIDCTDNGNYTCIPV